MSTTMRIIDNHVHLAGPGDEYPNDLYWSEKFEEGIGFKALKILKGWSFKKVSDRLMKKELLRLIGKARVIDHTVVLAFDNVYKPDGTYCGPGHGNTGEVLSTIYVSNKFVDQLRQQNKKVLLGISVHPFRDDAIEELEKYKDKAVLCKWIPSSQQIDFSDPLAQKKLKKFYKKLAEIDLPLLFHTGVETSIPAAREKFESYNSPIFIESALDQGVTVILAHCGCSFFDILLPQDNVVQEVVNLFKKRQGEKPEWKLYADISALFSPFRKRRILDDIFTQIPPDRLIYGSDYPNPAKGRKEFFLRPLLRYGRINLIDRNFRIARKWLKYYSRKKGYFTSQEADNIFTNFHRLLVGLDRGHLLH